MTQPASALGQPPADIVQPVEASHLEDEFDFTQSPSAQFRQGLRVKKGACQNALSRLGSPGTAHLDLRQAATNNLAQDRFSMRGFPSQSNFFQDLRDRITSSNGDFSPFQVPARTPSENPLHDYMRANLNARIYGGMGLARGAVALINGAAAVGGAISDGVHWFSVEGTRDTLAQHGIVRSHEEVEQGLQEAEEAIIEKTKPAARAARDYLQEKGVWDPIKRVFKFFTTVDEVAAQRMERELGVPQELSLQYERDVKLIVGTGAGNVLIGGVYKVCKKLLKETNRVISSRPERKPHVEPPFRDPDTFVDIISESEINQWSGYKPQVYAPPVQNLFTSFYRNLGSEPHLTPMSRVIESRMKEIVAQFPDYSPLNQSSQRNWVTAIRSATSMPSSKAEFRFYRLDGNDSIAKVTIGGRSFVVIDKLKEPDAIVGGLFGHDFQRSRNYRHLNTPEIVTIGQYEGGNRLFVVRTHEPGDTLTNIMKEIARKEPGSLGRELAMQDFIKANVKMGRAVGEYQSDGLAHRIKPSPSAVEKMISMMKMNIEENLVDLPFGHPLRQPKNYEHIFEGLRKNPGTTSYGFTDISTDQFLWSRERRKFTHVDSEYVPTTFSPHHHPISPTSMEYWEFMKMIEVSGQAHGLSRHETRKLQGAFKHGHKMEFHGELTPEAERFCELNSIVDSFWDLNVTHHKNPNIQPTYVDELINRATDLVKKP